MANLKNQVIKPIATAAWLIENTALTFEQIAEFCGINLTEVSSIADGFSKNFLTPHNPVVLGQLRAEEIKRCEANPKARLVLSEIPLFSDSNIKVSSKVFVPISERKGRLGAALWLVQNHPLLSVLQIAKLTGCTKRAAESLKDGTYTRTDELIAKDPTTSGICTQVALNEELAKVTPKE